jgi:hypothetical protein
MSTPVKPGVEIFIPAVQAGSLRAEYAVARAQSTGGWVAIGTVHSLQPPAAPPAWILVGQGRTEAEAVEDLRRQLERHARRAQVQRG